MSKPQARKRDPESPLRALARSERARARSRRFWYARLARSGFRDIETGPAQDGLLRTDKRVEPTRVSEYAAQAEYYRRATALVHTREWPSALERRIWELHAEGAPYKTIARKAGTYVKLVHETVGRIRREMLAEPARGGGRREPKGYHRGSLRLTLRFTDAEAEALFWLAEHLKCPPREALRAAVRVVSTQAGNARAKVS